MAPHLHTLTVRGSDASPARLARMLHGIYGRGRNLRRFATRLVEASPGWEVELVDLREHGESRGTPPPHTVEAAAGDVVGLAPSPDLLLGHSFGGKVALLTLRDPGFAPEQAWIIDSSPSSGEPGGLPWTMLGHLRRHPGPFETRGDAISALEGEGVPGAVAQWMATNLERTDEGLRWEIDPDAMEALLRSYFEEDAWDVVEDPGRETALHFVRAAGSPVIDGDAASRIEAAGASSDVHLHEVGGGHWLHTENPEGLLAVMEPRLPG